MTKQEIRGIAGQLFLVLLSLLPMYIFAGEGPSQPAKELPAETATELVVQRIA